MVPVVVLLKLSPLRASAGSTATDTIRPMAHAAANGAIIADFFDLPDFGTNTCIGTSCCTSRQRTPLYDSRSLPLSCKTLIRA